jgi:IMP dehydrogenase
MCAYGGEHVIVLDEVSRSLNEYLLIPGLTTEDCTPGNVDLSTSLVRHPVGGHSSLRIALPVVSAIMEAVSSPRLAIALAQAGGIAFIHQNHPVAEQAADIQAVKRHKAGFRHSDLNVKPSATLGEVTALLRGAGQDVAVVTSDGTASGTFLGLIGADDFHPQRHQLDLPVRERMRPAAELVTAPSSISLQEANTLLWDRHLHVLPVIEDDGRLASLVLRRDYLLHKRFANESVDGQKRFLVAAGINTRDHEDRIPALVEAGADLLCIDSSDGYSAWQHKALEFARDKYGDHVHVGAGNVVDGAGFRYLAGAGASFVKVGIGGGSICITRDQKGIGREASALLDVAAARDDYADKTGVYVPLCCDGGVLSDRDMAIALAMGADFIMMGRYFARLEESPSRKVMVGGQVYKEYWGEGSRRARNTARYGQHEEDIAFPEGVDGLVPYAGSLADNVAITVAKLKATMVSCGALTLREFRKSAVLTVVSTASYAQNTAEVQLRDRPVDTASA